METLAAPQKPASDSTFGRGLPGKSKLILPVEDERIVARDLQMRLNRLGYHVPSIASSKAEALELLEYIRPDMVLMDIQLNGIPEGIDAAREIRERFDLPIIYLTAHSDSATLESAMVTEPFGYILKPFEDRELLAAIETGVYKHKIERRLREAEHSLRRQVEMMNLSHDAIITTDSNHMIIGWNAGAQEIYGWTEREAAGQPIHEILKTEATSSIAEVGAALQQKGRWDGELIHTARNGDQIFVESRQVLVRGESGEIIGVLEVNRDISDRKRAEAALQHTLGDLNAAVAEKTVLLKEIHHRVKNNLAVISSLLGMKADLTGSPEAKLALEESQQRVRSIALIHEHLYGTDHLSRVRFGEYAQNLAEELRSAFGADSRGIYITMEADPVELPIVRAVPCALIVNELVTNALKHAFPDGRTGGVGISFRRVAENYELIVEDDGVGLTPKPSDQPSKSLGVRIINILTRQLDGSLKNEPGPNSGTRFVLSFPAETR